MAKISKHTELNVFETKNVKNDTIDKMNMFKKHHLPETNTKPLAASRGMASMYLVVFVTMLTGIITLSFTRIMLSDSKNTSAADLSQSAYDAALAGIEEAKLAILFYHDCLSKGITVESTYDPKSDTSTGNDAKCKKAIYYMNHKDDSNGDCDVTGKVLGRRNNEGGEVLLRSDYDNNGGNTKDKGDGDYIDQAYTCVKITEELDNYKATLAGNESNGSTHRIIPIRTNNASSVEGVILEYHGTLSSKPTDGETEGNNTTDELTDSYLDLEPRKSGYLPIISFEFFQTPNSQFSMTDLDYPTTTTTTTHSMVLLYSRKCDETAGKCTSPKESDPRLKDNFVDKETFTALASKNSQNILSSNSNSSYIPKTIKCYVDSTADADGNFGYNCKALLEFPTITDRAPGSFFIRLGMPYGGPNTNIKVTLCNSINKTVNYCRTDATAEGDDYTKATTNFTGVQAEIDSNGRAGTFYRRVKARVELVDVNFTYPEFAVEAVGNNGINKNFWVTDEACWYANDGKEAHCSHDGSDVSAGDYDGKF